MIIFLRTLNNTHFPKVFFKQEQIRNDKYMHRKDTSDFTEKKEYFLKR